MAHVQTEDLPTLDEAGAVSAVLVGRKAATLAGLRAAGVPVPDGIVVPPWALVVSAPTAHPRRLPPYPSTRG